MMEELHECFSLDDPVVPLDLPEQWDERTGKALDMEKVVKGRLKELQKLEERGVYVHVRREDAMQDCTGKFVKTRWVQTAKGDEVRCRFVAQEFAKGDPREDLFADTPLFSRQDCLSAEPSSPEPRCTLMVLDVSCAFFFLRTSTDGCASSCQQKIQEASVGKLWRSLRSLYMGPAMLLKFGWMS